MAGYLRTNVLRVSGLTSCLLFTFSLPAYASCVMVEYPDNLSLNLAIAFITGILGMVLSFRSKKFSAGMVYFLAASGFLSVAIIGHLLPIETAFRYFYPTDLASQSGGLRVKVDYSIFLSAIKFDIFAMISVLALAYSFKSKKTQKLSLLFFSLILVVSLTLGHTYIFAHKVYRAAHDKPCCSPCYRQCPESLYDLKSSKLCE